MSPHRVSAARFGALSIVLAIAIGAAAPARACGAPMTNADALVAAQQRLDDLLKSPEQLREARGWVQRREGRPEASESVDEATLAQARAYLGESRALSLQAQRLGKAHRNADKVDAKTHLATAATDKAFTLLGVDGPIFPAALPMRCGAQRS
jgi:hypothetical protein